MKAFDSIFLNQGAVLLLSSILLLVVAELAYRFGRAASGSGSDTGKMPGGAIQGGVLGLVGLLLSFTFAAAVSRHDARRLRLVEEANSIGTTWLRADLLPAGLRQDVKELLRRYTQLRLDGFHAGRDAATIRSVLDQVSEIHTALWSHASAAMTEQPTAVTVSFITSLNETIDLHTKRIADGRYHIPTTVWLLLLMVTGSGVWISSYHSGIFGPRPAFSQVVFPLLIGVLLTLISDIDSPRTGLVGNSQQSMEELLESMQSPPP